MSIPLKPHAPQAQHDALRIDLLQLVGKYADQMDREEMLAVAAHIVGQIVAVQDPTSMTHADAFELIAKNIEMGNKSMADSLRKQQLEHQPVAGSA